MLRKTIKFILVFLFFVVVADLLLSSILTSLYKRNRYGMSGGSINYYLQHPRPDFLIMGSSRAHHNLIPDSISKSCFNLSHNGMRIGFHATLLAVLEKKNALPKQCLIMQIEPEDIISNEKSIYYDIQFLKFYYHSNDFVKANINKIGPFESVKYLFRSYVFNGTVASLLKNNIQTYFHPHSDYNGFDPILPDRNDSMRTLISANNEIKNGVELSTVPAPALNSTLGTYFFNHIQSICLKNNIKLICFTSPYFFNKKNEKMYETLNTFMRNKNIIYYNFSKQNLNELHSPWLWNDNAHLNMNGAKVFSHIFSEKLKSLPYQKNLKLLGHL